MRALYSAIIAALAMTIAVDAQAQDQAAASKQIAARVELHAVPSLTISDQQFLTGNADGKQVNVTGCASRRAPGGCRSSS